MRAFLSVFVLLGIIIFPEAKCQSTQVGPKDFAVMAWGGSPSNAEQLRGMKEAGLNISGFCQAKDLDKVRAAGLTCFVRDGWIDSQTATNPPSDSEIRQHFVQLKAQIGANPAALGVFLHDEPSGAQMPELGKLAAGLRKEMPGKWPYVNLFPYFVSPQVLGTGGYDAYVRKLVSSIGQPFLSYDNYSLVGGRMLDSFYTNLEIVRRLSLATNTRLWNTILACAHFNYMEPSDATFNLQVYSTMAYGGRGIQYFEYFTPMRGNYRLAAVDQFGNRTATWNMLRRINNQIHELAPTLVRLHSTGVYHFPDVPDQGQPLSASKLIQSVDMTRVPSAGPPVIGRFLIGEFQDDRQRPYFMIVNKDLKNSFQFQIHLKQAGRKLIHISPYYWSGRTFQRRNGLARARGRLLVSC